MDLCATPLVKLVPPAEGRILLHACCAPCSSAILECIVQNGLKPTVFFSNSNITPLDEYELRKAEIIRYCGLLGVDWVDDDYDHADWLSCVARGREEAPERGPRCLECFRYRLTRAAAYAAANGFAVLATTLASSRWKDLDQVNAAGFDACAAVSGVTWWDMNWRKGGLQPRRAELIRELGFYNQTFCGCEYSKPKE
ncbi:MAG: epoxyqueuosine reductase QueH [Bacteroidales bacterium]|nr:epoxyqueuosine reductase QueH [Bacteroidales bacterium]